MEHQKRVLALGFFDGIHIGHSALMERALKLSAEKELIPAVITFDAHPMNMVTGQNIPLINSLEDRAGLIRSIFGITDVIFIHFDEDTMHMPWYEFVDGLVSDFNAAHLVCGHDYRFGYKGEGTPEKLKVKCAELGLGCDIIPDVVYKGIRSSSTHIRSLIANGDIEQANEFLGHPHILTDTVRVGRRLGRTIDAPTINMHFGKGVLEPRHGVYATQVYLDDGSIHVGVTNVGIRPTVDNSGLVTAETYILGYDGNLYGRPVRLCFYKFLRPEMCFGSVDELKTQIHADAKTALSYFESI